MIIRIWGSHKKDIWHASRSNEISPWGYDPSQDVAASEDKNPFRVSIGSNPRSDSSDLGVSLHANDEDNAKDEDDFEWPSDEARYKSLSPSIIAKRATVANSNVPTFCLRASHGARQMAQHQVSTLRILIHKMRTCHKEVFDGFDSNITDRQFWEMLYIGWLDEPWNIPDEKSLSQRFGWVLHFIRTNELSDDAQRANVILRDALRGILQCEKHPYNYEIPCTDSKLLKPDLSQDWVQNFLEASQALPAVEAALADQLGHLGIGGFCHTFGLLIADL